MPAWCEKIADAQTPEALVDAVRDHLATLTPEQFADVPSWLTGLRVKGVDDLAYWQKRLAEEYCDGGALRDAEAALVSQLLAIFTIACERGSQIARAADPDARTLFSDNSLPTLFKEPAPPA
jgi:hypothetical protein